MKQKNNKSFWNILKSYLTDNAFYLVILLFASALIAMGISYIANIPYKAPIVLCAVVVYIIIEISHFIKYYTANKNQ